MLHFTEILNRKVYTEDGILVGCIHDLIFTFQEVAQVTKLYVKAEPLNEYVFIPVNDIVSFGDDIILRKHYVNFDLQENELYVRQNILDKQIIDIRGRKVVRVNDVIIQAKDNKNIYITGVDVGLLSILRWIGLEKFIAQFAHIFGITIRSKVLSWKNIQPLELSSGKVVLDTAQERLERFLPEDLADYLEATNIENVISALDLVDKDFATDVIAELNLNYQIALFDKLGFKKTVQILELMDPDEAVDVLLQFDEIKRKKIMKKLEKEQRNELQGLIDVSKTNVGQYMTTEYITANSTDTVQQVIDKIKKHTRDYDYLFYIYVVNEAQELQGVVNIHELITHKATTRISKIMHRNLVMAYLNTPIQIVIRRMVTYKLYALPVVSYKKKIIGIIVLDDVDEMILEQLL